MDKTELSQLNRTLNTAIQKLLGLETSLEVSSTRNVRADISNIVMLSQIEPLISNLEKITSIQSSLTNRLYRLYNRTLRIDSPEALDDEAIYALYTLTERGSYISTYPRAEIIDAINCVSFSRRQPRRENIVFKDGTILLDHQLAVPKNLPEDAISADNVAQFCIGMNLAGKQLSFTLLRHLIANKCVKILEYIVRNEKKLSKDISPIKLLLTTLVEWPSPVVTSPLQVLAAIEETYPGTITSAEDAKGNNALWFASYLVNNWSDIALGIGNYFASCGCDLDKPFRAGFSWNTMIRLMSIIKRHEQDETNTP